MLLFLSFFSFSFSFYSLSIFPTLCEPFPCWIALWGMIKVFWLDLNWLLTWLLTWLVTWLPHAFLPQPLFYPRLSAQNSQRGAPKWWNCWNNLFCDPVTLFKPIKIKMFIRYEKFAMDNDQWWVQWLWNVYSMKLVKLVLSEAYNLTMYSLSSLSKMKTEWDHIHSIIFFSTVF